MKEIYLSRDSWHIRVNFLSESSELDQTFVLKVFFALRVLECLEKSSTPTLMIHSSKAVLMDMLLNTLLLVSGLC
jgi:hypothetical protein